MPTGTIGPLTWTEWSERHADMTITTSFYSDLDMQCPETWYGGYKEGRVTRWGVAERQLSDPWTGEWRGSTFQFSVSDYDLSIRPQLVSTGRYWSQQVTIRMTTRENRAALGVARAVFVGTIIDAQPTRPLAWDITLGDSVSQGLLADEHQLPWRKVRDGFVSQLDEIDANLDVDSPEYIIYGEHRRVPDLDPASPQGFVFKPLLLGKQTLSDTNQYYCWLVAGHACANILDIYVDGTSVIAAEGSSWLVPHHAGWRTLFVNDYADYDSDTFDGVTRRYTLIYGLVGSTNPDNCAAGTATLTVALQGVEASGEGTSAVISDRLLQYKHFAINYLANFGADSYQSGFWLDNPVWSLIDGDVPIVDEASFDAVSAIGIERLPPDGYIGAAVIGYGGTDSARRWIADWNRSCFCRFGWTASGQMRVVTLHPTAAVKAAAPLYTDAYEIHEGTFATSIKWSDWANSIPFKADFEYASGQWKTLDVATWDDSVTNYGRTVTAEAREYPFAPGITAAFHLARLEVLVRKDPPRVITLASNVDPDGLADLEIGDYLRYRHFAAVATSSSQIRLGQIQRVAIDVAARKCYVDVLDCEDLIDFDALVE